MRPLLFSALLLLLSPSLTAQYCIEGRFDDTLFAKGQITLHENLKYGEAIDWTDTLRDLLMDVYEPDPVFDTLDLRPLIVYYHGGGFHAGSKNTRKSELWSGEFAKRGFVVAAIDYRVGWPIEDSCAADTTLYMEAIYRASQDARAAWRYLIENAATYDIDTSEIYFLGSSAGAALCMITSYMFEDDFGDYLSEALGPLETSGNSIPPHPMNIKGIITKSAAIPNLTLIDRSPVPHILFHGNCDLTVPYQQGPILSCFAPDQFVEVNGSARIADRLERNGTCFTMYQSLGNGHTAAADDTVLTYGGEFIKSQFCDNCEIKRWNRLSGKNICKDNAEGNQLVVELIYPNPATIELNAIVSVPLITNLQFRLYNMQGYLVRDKTVLFDVAKNRVQLDVSDLQPGTYLLRVGERSTLNTFPVVIH